MRKVLLLSLPILALFLFIPERAEAQPTTCEELCASETFYSSCVADCRSDRNSSDGGGGGGASCSNIEGIGGLFGCALELMRSLIFVLIGIAVLFIVWAGIRFIGAEPGEEGRHWRDNLVYGVIALAVILSVWGLVNILRSSFGLRDTNTPEAVPRIEAENQS